MSLTCLLLTAALAAPQTYTIDPTRVVGHVDVRIYGQFLEHIFNSVHGGLWGDQVLNPALQGGQFVWQVKDGEVTESRPGYFNYLPLGDAAWTDYECTFEAFPEGGQGNVDVLDVGPFRYTDDQHFYHLRLGAKGRTLNLLERNGERGQRLWSQPYAHNLLERQWLRVRLRCEGARLQVWVNDQPQLDFTDKERPFLAGKVGLNITSMATRFRNLRVTSLDGRKVLWSGLPSPRDLSIRPAPWEVVGQAGSVLRPDQPEPGRRPWTVLTCEAGELGVQQRGLNLVKGMTYRGRMTLRGTANLVARLADEHGQPLAEAPIGGLTGDWRTLDFTLAADRDCTNGALQLLVVGPGRVDLDWVSLLSQAALDCGGFRPDLLAVIAAQRPATIRYPGGCFASFYHWKDGIGPHERRQYFPRSIWDDTDPSQFGTDEFMELCRRVGAEPILCLNAAEGSLERCDAAIAEALEWIEYCNGGPDTTWGKVRAANGHPAPYNVKVWEIDNETWGWQVDRYAAIVHRFATAIRVKYPELKLAACGGYGYDDGGGSTKGWNQRLLDLAARDFDYLSLHYYNGIPMEKYPWDHIGDPRRYERYLRDEVGPMIARSANPAMRVYVSEWGQIREDWPSGPYTGGLLNGFERLGELIPLSCPAVWLQTAPPRWWSSSILYDNHRVYTTPQYLVGQLWRDHYAPNRVRLTGPDQPLNVVAAATEDGRTIYVKLVNPYPTATEVELTLTPGWRPRSATMKLLAADLKARNSLDRPDALKVVDGDVKLDGQTVRLTLPANSVAVATLAVTTPRSATTEPARGSAVVNLRR